MKFLDRLTYPMLILMSLGLGLAPFFPMPHSVEKLIMLKNGELVKPIDIFDLIMHTTPIILLVLKVIRDRKK